MFNKKILISATLFVCLSSSLSAITLRESVIEAIDTNPVVQERLKNYRATQQDLNIAESEYYPKLDLNVAVGYNAAGEIKKYESKDWNNQVAKQDYGSYETQLKLTQNLFDGFGTTHKVDYQEARILAAAYNYVEKANDIAFKMTNAYLNVLRSYELLQTARENVQINESILKKVKDLFNAGLTTDSEVKKIESALSLARANLIVQKNNTRDTEFNYRRILGRMPNPQDMKKPDMNIPMPESLERATLYAINHNPSLLVSKYNIKGAQSLMKQHRKEYYPTVDLELSQSYNDVSTRNAFDNPDDRFQARIVMNYNLFRGGADTAAVQKDISKVNQEVAIKRDLKRQVIEGLDLSWDAYVMIDLQLKDLQEYSAFSEKTLELYKEEYDLGRRSLLDLLSAQNDVINSRSQIITAKYNELFAKYRILDAMGLLPMAIIGDVKAYTARVNLHTDGDVSDVLDTLPVHLDVDNDKIPDNEDLCDNSVKKDDIMPYGCVKDTSKLLEGKKNVYYFESKNYKASSDFLDKDKDGVVDTVDECLNSPAGYAVDKKGCIQNISMTVDFAKASSKIPKELTKKIDEFASFMKQNPDFNAKIVGHTSRTSTSSALYNIKLSKDRARAFKDALVKRGISKDRLSYDGKGFAEPIADNATHEGRIANRRVEIELTRKGDNS